MTTVLDRQLKRRITVDGVDYTMVVDPEGVRVTGIGRRRPEVALRWRDLLTGDAAMTAALNASLARPHPSADPKAEPSDPTDKRAATKRGR